MCSSPKLLTYLFETIAWKLFCQYESHYFRIWECIIVVHFYGRKFPDVVVFMKCLHCVLFSKGKIFEINYIDYIFCEELFRTADVVNWYSEDVLIIPWIAYSRRSPNKDNKCSSTYLPIKLKFLCHAVAVREQFILLGGDNTCSHYHDVLVWSKGYEIYCRYYKKSDTAIKIPTRTFQN